MKILVISDDTWHPAEVVELGLRPLEEQFDFTYVHDAKDILTWELLRQFDAVALFKGDCINSGNHEPWFEEGVTQVKPRDFLRYVEEGGGFLSFHAGNCFREGTEMTRLLGNYFIGHPPRCRVEVHFSAHPVTQGVEDFSGHDEHYQIEVIADDVTPFATSSSEAGGTQIAGYTRQVGKGRIVVFTPGHTYAVLSHPSTQRLFANAARWVMEGKA